MAQGRQVPAARVRHEGAEWLWHEGDECQWEAQKANRVTSALQPMLQPIGNIEVCDHTQLEDIRSDCDHHDVRSLEQVLSKPFETRLIGYSSLEETASCMEEMTKLIDEMISETLEETRTQ